MFLQSEVRLESSMARHASDFRRCHCVFLLHVLSISFDAFENFLALVARLLNDSFLLHRTFERMFLSHMHQESFFSVENFLAFLTSSFSYSSHNNSSGIVMRFVVFFQIVIAFGSVGTKRTEEARLSHVCVDVRPKQCLLTEEFIALITDEGIFVGRRPSLSFLCVFVRNQLSIDPPSMVFVVMLLLKLFRAEENHATTTHEELVVDFWCVFGN